MLHKILDRQNNPGVVGIPTDQGMEFIAAKDILRCEGLNKYTLIVCSDGLQLVSSYNIGEFAKQLQPFSFFAPHKSHLVNLAFIKRLNCENQIVLRDGTAVPLSRRRRLEFLQRFRVDGGCH
jgi:two-component system LytT family response regulator